MATLVYLILSISLLQCYNCKMQFGPDPWDYEEPKQSEEEADVPPDLRITPKVVQENNQGISEIFIKRILGMVLRGGQVQKYEDGSVEILLQMRFESDKWNTLDSYMKSNTAITESMLRKTMGYIEDAVYKPTIFEKIVMAWTDYIHIYLVEYKIYIVWTCGLVGTILVLIWLWKNLSHRHLIIFMFIALYLYEVVISYKEAEQQELDRFLSALNGCQWQFWKSTCEVPPPNIILFMKHMNPLKIAIRMFTTIISEPMISLSAVIKTMISGVTDGLWFPFDKIVYGFLILSFNALLIVLLVIIVFNYLLNIPFSLSFLGLSLGVKQRKRSLLSEVNPQQNQKCIESTDRISGPTLNKILDVVSNALNKTQVPQSRIEQRRPEAITSPKIRRSASTGRLCTSYENNVVSLYETPLRLRSPRDGSGDW